MTEGDLFSAGFAWDDVTADATSIATPSKPAVSQASAALSQGVATPVATGHAPGFAADFSWGGDSVASVASVATGDVYGTVSQTAAQTFATANATQETADFCASAPNIDHAVADVASVANWTIGIERLSGARCPAELNPATWRGLVMDARMLLQNWGGDLISMGWTTLEVFGVNRSPAARRLDVPGLIYFLKGRQVEAIDADTALIRENRRDTMTFQRRLVAPGGVPIWNWTGEARQRGVVGMAGGGKRFQRVPPHPRHVNPDQGER